MIHSGGSHTGESRLDDRGKGGRYFRDVGKNDDQSGHGVDDGHDGDHFFRNLTDPLDTAENDQAGQGGDNDTDHQVVSSEGVVDYVRDGVGLNRPADEEMQEKEKTPDKGEPAPVLSEALLHNVHKTAAVAVLMIRGHSQRKPTMTPTKPIDASIDIFLELFTI